MTMIKCGTSSDNTARGKNVYDAEELFVTGTDKPKPKKPKKPKK